MYLSLKSSTFFGHLSIIRKIALISFYFPCYSLYYMFNWCSRSSLCIYWWNHDITFQLKMPFRGKVTIGRRVPVVHQRGTLSLFVMFKPVVLLRNSQQNFPPLIYMRYIYWEVKLKCLFSMETFPKMTWLLKKWVSHNLDLFLFTNRGA